MTDEVIGKRRTVAKFGERGAHVNVPAAWIGKEVLVIPLDRKTQRT